MLRPHVMHHHQCLLVCKNKPLPPSVSLDVLTYAWKSTARIAHAVISIIIPRYTVMTADRGRCRPAAVTAVVEEVAVFRGLEMEVASWLPWAWARARVVPNVANNAATQHCTGPNESGTICDATMGTTTGSASYPSESHADLCMGVWVV